MKSLQILTVIFSIYIPQLFAQYLPGDRSGCPNNQYAWYIDNDHDGAGNKYANPVCSVTKPIGNYVANNFDCDDSDNKIYTESYWYQDLDRDGHGNALVSLYQCKQPIGYIKEKGDKHDQDASIHPGAIELCDGKDNDQDGSIDEDKPATPDAPTITNYCGSTRLTRGTPPYDTRWYWQSTASDTSTSNSNSYITRYSGTIYYLRAQRISTGCWSSSSRVINYTVNAVPAVPTKPTVVQHCQATELRRRGTPSIANITWYWQSSATGTSDLNSSPTITLTSGTIYYLRSRNDVTKCWGPATSVTYSIDPGPLWYADTDNDGFGDPSISQRSCTQPAGYVANNNDICPGEQGYQSGCVFTLYKLTLSNENYVFTRTYQEPMLDTTEIKYHKDVIENITYFDGLGRPKQQIAIQGAPNEKDIVTHIAYDAYGRQDKQYLPYVSNTPAGSYKTVNINNDINSYYLNTYPEDFPGIINPNEVNAYSESIFEPSPLNRVLEQGAPGTAWKANATSDSDHTIKFDWDTNTLEEVIFFEVTFTDTTNTEAPSLTKVGYYSANQLYKTITKDENWKPTNGQLHTTEEFKDKQGRVVLKRTFNSGSSGVEKLDTYYVYDAYGNLTYVIPPKVTLSATDGVSTVELNELCYQYHYDYRNRLIEKKIPGKGWESIVYNKLDQPILTQDTLLKQKSQWLFTKYDAFGRVAYTGKLTIPNKTRGEIQTEATAFSQPLWVQGAAPALIGGTTLYYDDGAYPKVQNGEVLTVNYYDDYAFLGVSPTAPFIQPASVYDQPVSDRTKTLATGSRVKVLGTSFWTTTVTYYDKKARPIYIASQNEYLDATDVIENKLDFVGKVLENKTTHTKGSNAPIVTIDSFEYDHMGRLLNHNQQLDGGTIEQIAYNTYDALGQLQKKYVGGVYDSLQPAKGLQEVDYRYNIRGWLTGINNANSLGNDLFGFGINYNTPTETSLGAAPLYNGNISETLWQTASDQTKRAYGYQYDPLNRIIAAKSSSGNYDLSNLTYDTMGNILSLNRKGHIDNEATIFGQMDNLSYRYDTGNKLLAVTDSGNTAFGFKDGTNTGDDYLYDANGNMIHDANKGITSITYNHLNLPETVTVNSAAHTGNITYIYDATGVKLQKISTEGSSLTTEYAGNYIYENGVLQFFNQPEGYIEPSTLNGYDYIYQYKDHLGNIRLSYSDKDRDGQVDILSNYAQVESCATTTLGYDKTMYPWSKNPYSSTDMAEPATITLGGVNVEATNQGSDTFPLRNMGRTNWRGKDGVRLQAGNTNDMGSGQMKYRLTFDKPVKGLAFYVLDINATEEMGTIFTEYVEVTLMSNGVVIPLEEGVHFTKGPGVDYAGNNIFKGNRLIADNEYGKKDVTFNITEGVTSIELTFTYSGLRENPSYAAILLTNLVWQCVVSETYGDADGDLAHEIREEKQYYPFGMQIKYGVNHPSSAISGIPHKYGYQSQEEEKELGKNTVAFQWRDYDPAIGRFHKIDRFSEKYVRHSPYSFTKNNPIRFQEIAGDSLWISFGKNNENRALYQDGQLLNKDGSRYEGAGVKVRKNGSIRITNSFLKKSVNALDKISSSESNVGTDVVSSLQSSENNFTISHAKYNPRKPGSNEFAGDNRNASYAVAIRETGQGIPESGGSGGTIYWNTSSGNVQELGGNIGFRPITNLGHEMFHAYDANFGLSDNRPSATGLSRNEGRAAYFENQLRGQLGYSLREFYNTRSGQFRLLNSNNDPIRIAPPSIMTKD